MCGLRGLIKKKKINAIDPVGAETEAGKKNPKLFKTTLLAFS